jgi:hypothetical protein
MVLGARRMADGVRLEQDKLSVRVIVIVVVLEKARDEQLPFLIFFSADPR